MNPCRVAAILVLAAFLSALAASPAAGTNSEPAVAANVGAFSSAGSLATARESHKASVLANGQVLITGGRSKSGFLRSAELYDPASNSWTAAGSLAAERFSHTASVLANGKVLVAGGINSNNSVSLSSAELYDPASNTWTAAGSLVTARSGHTESVLANGKVLVTGGYNNNTGTLRSAELYDPATTTWTAASSLPTGRFFHTASVLANGKVLVTGGYNLSSYLSSAVLYDPASNTWTAVGSLAAARDSHTASVLANGKVLVTGGNNSVSLSSAELYDPASNTWTPAGSLATARSAHTASMLANGQVLVAGGYGISAYLSSAELYDPVSNTWTESGMLTTERDLHTASVLANGKVLVTGGHDGNAASLLSAELYDAQSVAVMAAEGATPAQTGTFSDTEGNATVTLTASSGTVAQNNAAGTWSWTPGAGFDGPASTTVTITATDSAGATASAAFPFKATNLVPRVAISAAAAAANLNVPVNYTFTATDASAADQAGAFSWTLNYGDGTGVQTVEGTSSLAQTHVFSDAGIFEVTAVASDKDGGVSSVATRTIAIANITASVATTTASSLSATGATFSGTVNANGSSTAVKFSYGTTTNYDFTVTAVPSPVSDLAVTPVSATVTGLAPHTLYHFRVSATKPVGTSLGADATFTTLNTEPVAAAQTVLTNEDTAKSVTLAGTDSDGDTISFALVTQPAHGTIAFAGSTATYTPALDFNGTDSFTFTASDAFGGISVPATVSLTVMAVNDSPAIAVNGGKPFFSAAASLATARTHHTASVLANGKVLVAGSEFNIAAELYDPAGNTWTAAGSLATRRDSPTATVLASGRVLVAGGHNGFISPYTLVSAELYDPASNTWRAAGNLAAGRLGHTASVLANGKVLVTGGNNSNFGYLFNTELYNPANNTWTAAGNLTARRSSHTASLLANGKVFLTGGYNGSTVLSSADLYDPTSNTSTAAGSLATGRSSHTASVLANGKVLVTGGNNSGSLSSVELYDPASNTWTAAGSLATARYLHTASVLPNGQVLVTGGFDSSAVYLSSAELYDPASNTWIGAGSLATARSFHTASVLANGKVLITGGHNGKNGSLSSTELYEAPPLVVTAAAEGATAAQTGTFSDPDGNATVTLSASSGTLLQDNAAGTWSWMPAAGFDGPASSTVTITAADSASVTASSAFTFTAANSVPAAAISAAAAANLNVPVNYSFTATDESPADQAGAFSWTLNYGDGTGAQAVEGTSLLAQIHTFTTAGTFNVTATATDKDGGVSSAAARTIRIADITAPVIGTHADVGPIEAAGSDGAPVIYTAATATDDSGAAPTISYSKASGSTFAIGTTMVTVTAIDASNNTATASFLVTVLPLSAAQSWRHAHFGMVANSGAAAETADPDRDGLSNLQERAFATDPMDGGSGTLALEYAGTVTGGGLIVRTGQPHPNFDAAGNGINVVALFVRRADWVAQELIYTVEFSADLTTWAPSAAAPAVLADNGIAQVVAMPYPILSDGRPAGFFRVVVSAVP